MESYQLINKLDYSKDWNKDIALKFDAGKVEIKKYGEATLSGHFLLTTRHGEFPPVYIKQMEEKAYIWLNEMGLEECQNDIINKIKIPSMITLTAPGIDPEKLELYFKVASFEFMFDDAITKLNQLNKKNVIKQQEDIIKSVESLVSIIRNHGNSISTEAAISNLNPVFKNICIVLSHACRLCFKEKSKDDYERLARELIDFIRVNKWILEYHNSPYSKNEYLFLRLKDVGVSPALESIFSVKDIHISNEIRTHPLFRRYLETVITHGALVNDILSLRKESADGESENFVLIKCKKYNLQKSINKTVKAANKLLFDSKKCGIKLNSYFPSDHSLKDIVKTVELIVDGFMYWYLECRRYGDVKYEKYEVKYDYDYNNWLKEICVVNVENLKEPTLSG